MEQQGMKPSYEGFFLPFPPPPCYISYISTNSEDFSLSLSSTLFSPHTSFNLYLSSSYNPPQPFSPQIEPCKTLFTYSQWRSPGLYPLSRIFFCQGCNGDFNWLELNGGVLWQSSTESLAGWYHAVDLDRSWLDKGAEVLGLVRSQSTGFYSKVQYIHASVTVVCHHIQTNIFLLFFPPSAVFICSFMVAAPIFGYLGDRFNRKVILSCGIFFWSIVTLSSSFISKEVRHRTRALIEAREAPQHKSPSVILLRLLRLRYGLDGRANYSVMMLICLMSRTVKWNDTLVKSDTRLAFVDVWYISPPSVFPPTGY